MTTEPHRAPAAPIAFTVFGVVNLIIGVVSIVTAPVALLVMLKMAFWPEDPRVSIDLEHQWLVVMVGVLRVVLPFLMLGSGILLLRGKSLGRWLALVWIVAATLEIVGAAQLDWATIISPLLENSELRDPGAAPNLAETLGTVILRTVFVVGYTPFVVRFLFFDTTVKRVMKERRAVSSGK